MAERDPERARLRIMERRICYNIATFKDRYPRIITDIITGKEGWILDQTNKICSLLMIKVLGVRYESGKMSLILGLMYNQFEFDI